MGNILLVSKGNVIAPRTNQAGRGRLPYAVYHSKSQSQIAFGTTAALVTDGEPGARTVTHVWGPVDEQIEIKYDIPQKDGSIKSKLVTKTIWNGQEGWIRI